METRKGGKIQKGASEAELEEYRAQLNAKEAQLRQQSEMLHQQQEVFSRDKSTTERELEKTRRELEEKEMELNKKFDSLAIHESVLNLTNIGRVSEQMHSNHGNLTRTQSPIRDNQGHKFEALTVGPPPIEPYHDNYGPRISFKEALETVPQFDGRNIPLSQFVRACRRVKELFPPYSEINLTRLLLTKLRGRAICAVEDEGCETVTHLIDLLNGAFGSPRTIDQYRGELSTIYLRGNEHILDYISRTKDLRTSILDETRRQKGILTNDAATEIDQLAARSFCNGLPLSYRLQLTPDLYVNPFAAFSQAKALAKRQEIDNERFNIPRRNEQSTYHANQSLAQSASIKSRTINTSENNRDRKEYINNTSQQNPTVDRNARQCRYCKNFGHEIEECRKRQYNNSRQNQGNSTHPSRPSGESREGGPSRPNRPVNVTVPTSEESESRC